MTDLVKLLSEYGILIVLAAAFITMRFMEYRDYRKERQRHMDLEAEHIQIVANHISHNTDIMEEMVASLKEQTETCRRICIHLENLERQK